MAIRCRYIHSDVDTLERVQILEDLRGGLFDVLIGVNLLREGLDLPEVSLVAIIDADMEGMLRNVRAITQIAGRAARHANGLVIMYAAKVTKTMRESIEQSNRRRYKQIRYNIENGLMPRRADKSGSTQTLLAPQEQIDVAAVTQAAQPQSAEQIRAEIARAQADMERAAKSLDFLAAARYRDRIQELEKLL
jgi:excinuclease ABC subunit B